MTPNPASVTTSAEDALEVAADIRKLIASAPEHIWLDLGEALEALTDDGTFRDLQEVTWSEDNATGVGIKYVRADLSPALPIDFKQATDQGGWQFVPKEPTEEMLTAASHASMQHLLDCINDPAKADALGSEENIRKTYANRYQSMLAAAPPVTEDLSALVARLARALRKAAPGKDLAEKAMDYLRRKGLQGSPLRSAPTLQGVADGDAVGGKSGGQS